ncbi:nitronate monooxygenase [Mesorhizobium sp. M0494]|uniref:nitronate monooxygenase n=1 Tax=Mesorhizobium sp. M0494 TaxID=2956951 RepID=UPI00333C2D04
MRIGRGTRRCGHTAGGLGLIGGGYGDADWLTREFERSGNRPVGCGFVTWSLARNPRLLDKALERRPSAIFLSFGDPAPFSPAIRAAGVPLICQVQSLDDARRALDAGADIVVAQGAEAGGHGEKRATFTFVPEVANWYCDGRRTRSSARPVASPMVVGSQRR